MLDCLCASILPCRRSAPTPKLYLFSLVCFLVFFLISWWLCFKFAECIANPMNLRFTRTPLDAGWRSWKCTVVPISSRLVTMGARSILLGTEVRTAGTNKSPQDKSTRAVGQNLFKSESRLFVVLFFSTFFESLTLTTSCLSCPPPAVLFLL